MCNCRVSVGLLVRFGMKDFMFVLVFDKRMMHWLHPLQVFALII